MPLAPRFELSEGVARGEATHGACVRASDLAPCPSVDRWRPGRHGDASVAKEPSHQHSLFDRWRPGRLGDASVALAP